jgi:hypothetical protein
LRATAALEGARHDHEEKLLVLCVFVMVIVAVVVTHMASHLAFVLENCFALILPVLRS